MKLGTRGRYAVMAMVELAMRTGGASEAQPVTLAEIAARQDISQSYLEQLFGRLRRAGLVRSARGPRGGATGWRGLRPSSGSPTSSWLWTRTCARPAARRAPARAA